MLFNIFMNDLVHAIKEGELINDADDTNTYDKTMLDLW